jgi:enoyl-CoA hydratase/carnithine racemase
VRCAILTGHGGIFVSGGDLKELAESTTEAHAHAFRDAGLSVVRAFAQLPFPIIAAIDGPALGGGAELACACDMRVMSATAVVSFRQARMGVTCAWDTVATLQRLVGNAAAARLLFLGDDVGAEDARALGLVQDIATAQTDEPALGRALDHAQHIARGSPGAIRAFKELLGAPPEQLPGLEAEAFARSWAGPERQLAMAAFRERRPVRW